MDVCMYVRILEQATPPERDQIEENVFRRNMLRRSQGCATAKKIKENMERFMEIMEKVMEIMEKYEKKKFVFGQIYVEQ